jgi:hypothetical protein
MQLASFVLEEPSAAHALARSRARGGAAREAAGGAAA